MKQVVVKQVLYQTWRQQNVSVSTSLFTTLTTNKAAEKGTNSNISVNSIKLYM